MGYNKSLNKNYKGIGGRKGGRKNSIWREGKIEGD
jgi:hypothetical protein